MSAETTDFREFFHRRWVCGVLRSGFHNGATCHADSDWHDASWGCGWRWEASVHATPETDELFRAKETGRLEG